MDIVFTFERWSPDQEAGDGDPNLARHASNLVRSSDINEPPNRSDRAHGVLGAMTSTAAAALEISHGGGSVDMTHRVDATRSYMCTFGLPN